MSLINVANAANEITTENGVATIGGFEVLFTNVVRVAIAFAGIVFLIMLLIGGFNLITAGSEAPKAEGAKKTITFAIFGFIFIALSYLILTLISNFTGVDVTQFRIIGQ